MQTTRDPLMLAYWERVLNGLVSELYFPAEVHAAALRLFDSVEQAILPALSSQPQTGLSVPHLRTHFETLHSAPLEQNAHPLRLALDKLQTPDTVRIIEGKA